MSNGSASDWGLATTSDQSTSVGMENVEEDDGLKVPAVIVFLYGSVAFVLGALLGGTVLSRGAR